MAHTLIVFVTCASSYKVEFLRRLFQMPAARSEASLERIVARLSNSLGEDVASHHLLKACVREKHQVKRMNVRLVYCIKTKFYALVSIDSKLKIIVVTPNCGHYCCSIVALSLKFRMLLAASNSTLC